MLSTNDSRKQAEDDGLENHRQTSDRDGGLMISNALTWGQQKSYIEHVGWMEAVEVLAKIN